MWRGGPPGPRTNRPPGQVPGCAPGYIFFRNRYSIALLYVSCVTAADICWFVVNMQITQSIACSHPITRPMCDLQTLGIQYKQLRLNYSGSNNRKSHSGTHAICASEKRLAFCADVSDEMSKDIRNVIFDRLIPNWSWTFRETDIIQGGPKK